ncbi:hypothetical protein [Desulforhopalus sp. IMCC35007]|uniref:hypothetical protein n=1 Tax=Desulforhopalus sp. IMCC35007 TaxID=2569543 RepID=UPI0010AE944D|nr:hypothetical protein [Desulforhopalus sp. IMCC35007]TKB08145.1 hypothetical protein FCL48_14275 [Desulforhopalus sp. IMCC35007]
MRFCKDCGAVLNLFGDREIEYCSACIQHKKQAEIIHVPIPTEPTADAGVLGTTTLSLENGKIILRSQEGWELWSCTQGTSTELQTILTRAKRIYEIRLRRQKN